MIPRLAAERSILLVVDVQEKLLTAMPDAAALVRDVGYLIDTAKLLDIPVLATEQYPQGLGPTHAELARRLGGNLPTKTTFSCSGVTGLPDSIRNLNRPSLVVAGMETHVCVLQTVLDLLSEGYEVFVVVDAVQARFRSDHDTAIRRMERAGAIGVTVESTMFEWLGGSTHPKFKAVSKLVQERMKQIRG